jgi:hypothetical protein
MLAIRTAWESLDVKNLKSRLRLFCSLRINRVHLHIQRYQSPGYDVGFSIANSPDFAASVHRLVRRVGSIVRPDFDWLACSRAINPASVPPDSSRSLRRVACNSSSIGFFVIVGVSQKLCGGADQKLPKPCQAA